MDKTIIFLGAGASRADNAPLQAELFKTYVDCLKNKIDQPLNPSYIMILFKKIQFSY